MDPGLQVLSGYVLFFAGLLFVVLGAGSAVLKALANAVSSGNTLEEMTAPQAPGVFDFIKELMKTAAGLAVVLGFLLMHVGYVMLSGGTVLGIPAFAFEDPRAAAGS